MIAVLFYLLACWCFVGVLLLVVLALLVDDGSARAVPAGCVQVVFLLLL